VWSHCAATTGHSGKELTIEEMRLQAFPKNSQRRRRRDVLRGQSVPQSGSSDPEKLDRGWLKDGCVGQAMMTKQSGDADGP